MSEESTEMWRVTTGGRVGGCALIAVWIGISIGVTAAGSAIGAVVAIWIATVLIALGTWRWAFVPYVALEDRQLLIQNRIALRKIPYADIASVNSGYYGLSVRTKNGNTTTAWAVQKSNFAKWTHRTVRADVVADTIMARVPSAE